MDSVQTNEVSKPYDDDARLKLAENLDRELEDYISKLEKRSTNEAWPEDKWQEEMEKHPFFMTKIPETGELPPLLKGLQDLKYSTDENTPEELARAYKEDGNYHYKLKKYRMAIMCYTEGIKQRSNDVELNGQLYNNRAAAHYYLGNYRSCYNDCKCALRALPLYSKAICRLASTCFKLGLYDECLSNCELFRAKEEESREIKELQRAAAKIKKEKECEERRNILLQKKATIERHKLLKAIKERGITLLGEGEKEIDDGNMTDIASNPLGKEVCLVEGKLVWPVLLLYPEYETSDIIESFHEDHTFLYELSEIYKDQAEWDVEHKYSLKTICLYYESIDKNIKSVNLSSTLGSVLSTKDFRISNGIPTFLVLVKNSDAEKKCLQLYN